MRIEQKRKKSAKVFEKGFSLIEVLVAMFIFTLMAAAVSSIFAKTMLAQKNAKIGQKNLETAQFAMNQVAKNIRGSSLLRRGWNTIIIFNHSQKTCIAYTFGGSTSPPVQFRLVQRINSNMTYAGCKSVANDNSANLDVAIGAPIDMTSYGVGGTFTIYPSAPSLPEVVTIGMDVPTSATSSVGRVKIQTSVALRNVE
jgi:prepilin-type N-terminal cleavage/methylation domain-containing protein